MIKRRNENEVVKPYETLRNIIEKNKSVTRLNELEEKDECFNNRIDLIDKVMKAEKEYVEFLKNNIFEKDNFERNKFYIIIECVKVVNRIITEGKKGFCYLVGWYIRKEELNGNSNEVRFDVKYDTIMENEFKIILRSLILSLLLIE